MAADKELAPLLTSRELAAFLRVSPATVNDWRRRGRRKRMGAGPEFIKLGRAPNGLIRYHPDAVKAFLEGKPWRGKKAK